MVQIKFFTEDDWMLLFARTIHVVFSSINLALRSLDTEVELDYHRDLNLQREKALKRVFLLWNFPRQLRNSTVYASKAHSIVWPLNFNASQFFL